MINKGSKFLGILGACKLLDQVERSVVYKKIHGDKESYWIGFEMMEEHYGFNKWYPGSIGYKDNNNHTCGRMLHYDESGSPLWWNGGFKNAEKHVPGYSRLPYLKMEFHDDGGWFNQSEQLGVWTSDGNINYCISPSPRNSRPLSQDMKAHADQSIHAFRQFEKLRT